LTRRDLRTLEIEQCIEPIPATIVRAIGLD